MRHKRLRPSARQQTTDKNRGVNLVPGKMFRVTPMRRAEMEVFVNPETLRQCWKAKETSFVICALCLLRRLDDQTREGLEQMPCASRLDVACQNAATAVPEHAGIRKTLPMPLTLPVVSRRMPPHHDIPEAESRCWFDQPLQQPRSSPRLS
ncbi:hypothetical protein MAPG_04518 [Magnaporthiopsis poae ATCC 64411]|uniref:Uncharacterized protein n=1 Tax=Magnaporthiopsis poae (strain ATCC 64411 / 73-15) TaxID=644358 RepID=A0A0C4DWY4_MAGP6|nr:hypothetical protein MAPG_04518 [Magnaporthiopsis poae ATCC 64411]